MKQIVTTQANVPSLMRALGIFVPLLAAAANANSATTCAVSGALMGVGISALAGNSNVFQANSNRLVRLKTDDKEYNTTSPKPSKQHFVSVVKEFGETKNFSLLDKLKDYMKRANQGVIEDIKSMKKSEQLEFDLSSILMLATDRDDVELVDATIRLGVSLTKIEETCKRCEAILYRAAVKGKIKIVERLLREDIDIEKGTPDGDSPFYGAVIAGHQQVAQVLLDAGADINHQSDIPTPFAQNGVTPFFMAVQSGDGPMVDFLLKNNAEIDRSDSTGFTPLMKAIAKGHKKIITKLLDAGADVMHKDKSGKTALHYAKLKKLLIGQKSEVKAHYNSPMVDRFRNRKGLKVEL